MRPLRPLLLFVLTNLLPIGFVASVHAQPHVVDPVCDTLSTDPLIVEVSFGVTNTGSIPACTIQMFPSGLSSVPPDSCRLSECSAPDKWICGVSDGQVIWQGLEQPPLGELECIDQGETQYFYAVHVRPSGCCFDVQYYPPGILESFHHEVVCFECDMPVQTGTSSWGRIKSIYR